MNEFPNNCPDCANGVCREIVEDYAITTPEGESLVVPNIPVWRCDKCSAQWLSPEAADTIDKFMAVAAEQLVPAEINQFLEKYDLSQAEAGELLGLGEKTINRWLKGRQVVSRSMGFYIRLLLHFPDATQWLKERGWRNTSGVAAVQSPSRKPEVAFSKMDWSRFPALNRRTGNLSEVSSATIRNRLGNPAKGLLPAYVSHFSHR